MYLCRLVQFKGLQTYKVNKYYNESRVHIFAHFITISLCVFSDAMKLTAFIIILQDGTTPNPDEGGIKKSRSAEIYKRISTSNSPRESRSPSNVFVFYRSISNEKKIVKIHFPDFVQCKLFMVDFAIEKLVIHRN